MNYRRRERAGRVKYFFLALAGMAVVAAAVWLVVTKLEGSPPVVTIGLESGFVPAKAGIPVTMYDEKSGIRKVYASIEQNGRELTLFNETYDKSSPEAGDPLYELGITLDIDVREKGLADGDAMLRVAAWDRSWRGWFTGNVALEEKKIVIDSVPPRISPLTRQHNLSQGGSGVVVYRLSEPCTVHGVQVGDNFFRGYSGYFGDEDVYLAFFALRHDQNRDTDIFLTAEDRAGNPGKTGFPHYIQNRVFPAENLNISDGFLRQVLPEFQAQRDFPDHKPPIEQFLYINEDLRRKNNEIVLSLHENSSNRKHWEGAFTALPNAARRAGFADHRTYMHNGEPVDMKYHMGVDLASLKHAPIPAGNSGRVIFAEWVGIYGDTVVIDHGFGLLSLYAHLSRIEVAPGDFVTKGDIIGNTGQTGLAGGDHLHFSVIVGNVFVNPYEWWDASWIENNISSRLEAAARQIGR